MTDLDLAQEIIDRLNRLIQEPESPGVATALLSVMQSRISIDMAVADHPTLQVSVDEGCAYLGWLGILNGIVGVIPSGEHHDWGYITAVVEDDGTLSGFKMTGSV